MASSAFLSFALWVACEVAPGASSVVLSEAAGMASAAFFVAAASAAFFMALSASFVWALSDAVA
eukprot:scaffold331193_cov43-Attheya_sp.AAC.1